jgi:cyclin B
LTEYELIDTRDSMMAAAALYLAMKIKAASPDEVVWTPTLEFYSGYKSEDLFDLTHRVFNVVRNVPPHLKTIKTKYSHTIFFEVSKIPIPEELHL